MQMMKYLAKQGLAIGIAFLLSEQAFAMRPDDRSDKAAAVFHAVPLVAQKKASDEIVAKRKAAAVKRPDLSVRWECIRKTPPGGRFYYDAVLYFNGELIGRRSEYCDDGAPRVPGLILEVVEGQFRFDSVVIRELRKVPSL